MEDLGFVIAILFSYLFISRVSYRDGVMEDEPKPCAAVKGTQIMVCVNWTFEFICGLLVYLIKICNIENKVNEGGERGCRYECKNSKTVVC